MYRSLSFAAVVVAVLAAQANAIEMFTNFHNGENIGFPPMEVPNTIYGGLGRGGWNPHAQGTPFRSINPVPSMMPTGQVPGGRPCFQQSGSMPSAGPQQFNGNVPQTESAEQYVSDRRHGRWQRGSTNSANSSNQAIGGDENSGQPTVAPETRNNSKTQPNLTPESRVTILHAQSGNRPVWDDAIGTDATLRALRNANSAQSDSTVDDRAEIGVKQWSKGAALFPDGYSN